MNMYSFYSNLSTSRLCLRCTHDNNLILISFVRFIVYVPAVRAPEPDLRVWHPSPSSFWGEKTEAALLNAVLSKSVTPLHKIASATMTQFPDARLIQYDCGMFLNCFVLCGF